MKRFTAFLSILLLSAALTACGGGGGGGSKPPGNNPPPPPPPANKAPIAKIASLGEQLELATITLDGSASSDADKDTLTYQWKQTAGTPVALAATNAAKPTFRAPKVVEQETLSFELAVADGKGGSDKETIDVIVKEGNVVVFKLHNNAFNGGNGTEELYLSADALGAPALLSPPQTSDHYMEIDDYTISPDRRHVAFTANLDSPDNWELYVAALDGSGARKVSREIVNENGHVLDFAWSPDSKWIAYRGDTVRDNVRWLHSVRLTDNAHFTLGGEDASEDPFEESEVSDYVWRPQGDLVVRGGWGTNGLTRQLYLVAPDVEDANQYPALSNEFAYFDVMEFAISPDGTRVAWTRTADSDWRYLMLTDIDAMLSGSGTPIIDLGDNAHDFDGDVIYDSGITAFTWSPDSQHLAFFANQHETEGDSFSNFTGCGRVYKVAIDDPANPETVNELLGATNCFLGFQFSPDGERLAVHGAFTDGFPTMYRAYVDGMAVHGGIIASDVETMFWSPDGVHLAFVADLVTDNRNEVFLWSEASGDDVRLSHPAQDGELVLPALKWSPDGSAVGYWFWNGVVATLQTASSGSVDGSGASLIYDQPASVFHWTSAGDGILFSGFDSTCNCNSLLIADPMTGEITNLSIAVQDRDADGVMESPIDEDFTVPGAPAQLPN